MPDRAGRPSRVVGVLGGMGPRATVDFYDKLVAHTPAVTDQEHVRVVIWADPTVPDRQAAVLRGGTDPSPWLHDGVRHLADAGAEILVVPCNTVHRFLPQRLPSGLHLLSIIDVAVRAATRRAQTGPIGLLATDAALGAGLFQDALHAAGREVLLPDGEAQADLTGIVTRVKQGSADDATRACLRRVLSDLATRGAATTIAGCTEVSALLDSAPPTGCASGPAHTPDVVDPALELALAAIDLAFAPAETHT